MRALAPWLALAGCGGDDEQLDPSDVADADADADNDADADADSDADTDAFLRLAHLAPELGALDLWADDRGRKVAGPVDPGGGTAFYLVEAGEREVLVTGFGDPPSTGLVSATATLAPTERYSAVVWGSLAEPSLELILEDPTGLLTTSTRYTVFVSDPDLGPLDIIDPQQPLVLGTGTYAQRVTLAPDLPAGARALSLDFDRDGGPDCTFVVPNVGGAVVVALYVWVEEGQVGLLAHHPTGGVIRLNRVEPTCPAPG